MAKEYVSFFTGSFCQFRSLPASLIDFCLEMLFICIYIIKFSIVYSRKGDRRSLNVLAIVHVWSLVSIRAGALILITIAALGSTPAFKAWFRLVSELYYTILTILLYYI